LGSELLLKAVNLVGVENAVSFQKSLSMLDTQVWFGVTI